MISDEHPVDTEHFGNGGNGNFRADLTCAREKISRHSAGKRLIYAAGMDGTTALCSQLIHLRYDLIASRASTAHARTLCYVQIPNSVASRN